MQVTYLTFVVDGAAFIVGMLLYVLAAAGSCYLEERSLFKGPFGGSAIIHKFTQRTLFSIIILMIAIVFFALIHIGTAFFVWFFPWTPHPAIYL